jgi:hypothetical protein
MDHKFVLLEKIGVFINHLLLFYARFLITIYINYKDKIKVKISSRHLRIFFALPDLILILGEGSYIFLLFG